MTCQTLQLSSNPMKQRKGKPRSTTLHSFLFAAARFRSSVLLFYYVKFLVLLPSVLYPLRTVLSSFLYFSAIFVSSFLFCRCVSVLLCCCLFDSLCHYQFSVLSFFFFLFSLFFVFIVQNHVPGCFITVCFFGIYSFVSIFLFTILLTWQCGLFTPTHAQFSKQFHFSLY